MVRSQGSRWWGLKVVRTGKSGGQGMKGVFEQIWSL